MFKEQEDPLHYTSCYLLRNYYEDYNDRTVKPILERGIDMSARRLSNPTARDSKILGL